MNNNNIFITSVSVVAIIAFVIGAYFLTNKPKDVKVYEQAKKVVENDNIKWSKEKKHILLEYSDLQCPACKNYHDFITDSIEASGSGMTDTINNITFVYRNYPLTQIHKNAYSSATAAEAAGRQGKFFEYADRLFDSQNTWSEMSEIEAAKYFETVAKSLKLNVEQFKNDMKSSGVKSKIDADVASGDDLGVRGTPTFFLDGVKVEVSTFDEFKSILTQTAKK